jgi:hypothetical protein
LRSLAATSMSVSSFAVKRAFVFVSLNRTFNRGLFFDPGGLPRPQRNG